MVMTRERLESYSKLMREIIVLTQELQAMEGDSTYQQDAVDMKQEYSRKKQAQLNQKLEEAEAIRTWIEEIEDAIARQVFRLYYIERCNWMNVAKKTGYRGNPDYPRKMIRDKYLRENKIK